MSRISGLGRTLAIAAVLGPTYLGNTFQAINQLPNLIFAALTGSLLSVLLVPAVVAHVDEEEPAEVERVAGAFLGMTTAAFGAVALLTVVAGPLLLRVLAVTVSNHQVAAAQRRNGWLLLALVAPQIVLYGLAGIGEAVQNAHRRFALAAAAPVMENVGIIAVMAAVAVVYGTGADVRTVPSGELLLLGIGSTAAVTAHAGAQWWGARRVGVRLVPRAGWRDPDVRALASRALPSLGYAGLNSLRFFAMLVVANRLPGGVVAFQLALNFMYLPVALGGWPVAVAMLPHLARLHLAGALQRFRDELVRASALMLFVVIPAAAAMAVLAVPLSRAMAFGDMADARGQTLIAASVAALAAGLVGEAAWVVATHAAYARNDVGGPLRSMLARTGVSMVGMAAALWPGGTAVLVVLGLGVSAGNLVGSWHLAAALRRGLPATGDRLLAPVLRSLLATAVSAGPVYAVARVMATGAGGRLAGAATVVVATAAGAAVYLAVQAALRSPELGELRHGLPALRRPPG